MSNQLPITTAPKRQMNHPAIAAQILMNLNTSESCKNTPAVARKLDPHHRALLESGSQSASNSPLPQRRLDKLQGMINDKTTPLAIRRRLEQEVCGEIEPSPIVSRKYLNYNNDTNAYLQNNQRKSLTCRRNTTDCDPSSPMMRRRVDSDCTCAKKFVCSNNECNASNKKISTLRRQKTDFYGSPVKSVLGEPGVFSSPMHKSNAMTSSFGSPAKSVLGEPGVFASPARSISGYQNEKIAGEGDDEDSMLLQDQTVVSGWFKFRDNKKVRDFFLAYHLSKL
uniref:CSON002892 protein n=1 Tax=Culicoides sonorensis TaxID=179676 RepID=A0A336L3U4_CULSO